MGSVGMAGETFMADSGRRDRVVGMGPVVRVCGVGEGAMSL